MTDAGKKAIIALSIILTVSSGFIPPRVLCAQPVTLDFETGTFAGWKLERLVGPYSAQIVTDIVRKGKYAARFELRGDDNTHGGRRAELTDHYLAPIGSELWYGFSTYIPEDLPIEGGHCVFSQWHDTPDNDVERDADRNPPLAHRYRNGEFYVTLMHSQKKIQTENDGELITLYRQPRMPKGVWHDFIYHIKWSYKADGLVQGWCNGKKIIDYHGPVGYNDDHGIYFKIGVYRNDSEKTYIMYHDEYRRGKSYAEVDPGADH